MRVDDLIKWEIVTTLSAINKTIISQTSPSASLREVSNSIQIIFKLLKKSNFPSFWSDPRHQFFDWMNGRWPTFSVTLAVSKNPNIKRMFNPSLNNSKKIKDSAFEETTKTSEHVQKLWEDDKGREISESISQEVLGSIRTQLYKILSNQKMIPIIGMERMWKIHSLLIRLSKKMPINRECFGSGEVITLDDEAPISTGHVFALSEIIGLLYQSKHTNPYSNLPLLDMDVCYLIQLAITHHHYHHRKDDDNDDARIVTDFLVSLHYPKKVAYTNQLIFLLDDKDCPYQIYLLRSSTSLSSEEKKKMDAKIDVIKSSANIRRALYEGLISMRHIEKMPYDNLVLLNVFDKTLGLLRSRWRDPFLNALEKSTTVDIFSNYINRKEPNCLQGNEPTRARP